jgi:hypothetical protein
MWMRAKTRSNIVVMCWPLERNADLPAGRSGLPPTRQLLYRLMSPMPWLRKALA